MGLGVLTVRYSYSNGFGDGEMYEFKKDSPDFRKRFIDSHFPKYEWERYLDAFLNMARDMMLLEIEKYDMQCSVIIEIS